MRSFAHSLSFVKEAGRNELVEGVIGGLVSVHGFGHEDDFAVGAGSCRGGS